MCTYPLLLLLLPCVFPAVDPEVIRQGKDPSGETALLVHMNPLSNPSPVYGFLKLIPAVHPVVNQASVLLDDLLSFTDYRCKVQVENEGGCSGWGPLLALRTEAGNDVPEPPVHNAPPPAAAVCVDSFSDLRCSPCSKSLYRSFSTSLKVVVSATTR